MVYIVKLKINAIMRIYRNNTDKLYVTLTDSEGFDIGEQICACNHGTLRTNTSTVSRKENKYIPV